MPRVILKEQLYSPFAWDRYLQQLELDYYSEDATRAWAERFWPWIWTLSFAYVALCFLGVRWMRDRPRFQLRRPLVYWNAGLAIYSMFTLWRLLPGFVDDLVNGRYSDFSCSLNYFHDIGVWCFLFPFSKLFEFGDTLFVVLKKKKLIFLHWYHHITVLWFCWYCYVEKIGPGRMFSSVNCFVHAVMYTYYGVVASGLTRLPRWINMAVTTLQISQMFIGVGVTTYAYYRIKAGLPCAMTERHYVYSMLMYVSYMVLFGNYFYMTYIRKKPASATQERAIASTAVTNGSTKSMDSAASTISNGVNSHSTGTFSNGHPKSE